VMTLTLTAIDNQMSHVKIPRKLNKSQTTMLHPYHVSYPRTANWWTGGGDWYQISTWCMDNFGDRWDYVDQCFVFATPQHRNWFVMRWL